MHLGHIADPVRHDAPGRPAHDRLRQRCTRPQKARSEIGRTVGHDVEGQPLAVAELGDHLNLDTRAQGDQPWVRIVPGRAVARAI